MNQAVFWIVDGGKYVDEAAWSALSVKEAMPDLQRILFTPDLNAVSDKQAEPFTQIVRLSPRASDLFYLDYFRYVTEAMRSLPEQFIEFDTDVYMAEPVPELFDMLNYCDMAMAIAPGHRTAPSPSHIPSCFSEYNSGVIVQNNNGIVKDFWLQAFTELSNNKELYGNNDQSPMRTVLYENRTRGLRFATITAEYNCRFPFGVHVADKVKILHGHLKGDDKLKQYRRIVNEINSMPGFVTEMGAVMRLWNGAY